MIRILLILALAATAALAQAQSATPPPPSQSNSGPQTLPTLNNRTQQTDPAASVAPNTPVLTLHGACNNPQASGADCTTVLTKEQFDKLIDAANPNHQPVPPQMRRNLAQTYVELTAFSQAAEKAGISNDPNFQEFMRLMRMKTLGDFYLRMFDEKNRTASAKEIEAYYNQNHTRYEEVELARIFIPKNNPTGKEQQPDFQKKAEQVANDIHARAAKGEDLEKLQQEAYTLLGVTAPAPSTKAGTRRRGMMLPQEEQEVFALNPGELSKVEAEPTGLLIYKVLSKQAAPLEQVKDEIGRELFRQKRDTEMKTVSASVHADFNDQYFGPAATPAAGPAPGQAPGGVVAHEGQTPPPSKPPTLAPASKPPASRSSSGSKPKQAPPQ